MIKSQDCLFKSISQSFHLHKLKQNNVIGSGNGTKLGHKHALDPLKFTWPKLERRIQLMTRYTIGRRTIVYLAISCMNYIKMIKNLGSLKLDFQN